MKLKNKTVVVTGASSGMGRSITELFVKEGANVVAVARNKNKLDNLVASLKEENGNIIAYVGDISKKETNEKMINLAIEKFGKLDILINNAGIMDDMSPIAEASDEKFKSVIKTNTYGPFCGMRKACQVFLKQKSNGNIINISSIGSMHQAAGPVYCASKAALNALTRNTAFMYKNDNIRCNAIAPGGINTNIVESMGQPNPDGYQRLSKVLELSPIPGEVANIAQTALFLASDESSYINGTIIEVDGGWTSF